MFIEGDSLINGNCKVVCSQSHFSYLQRTVITAVYQTVLVFRDGWFSFLSWVALQQRKKGLVPLGNLNEKSQKTLHHPHHSNQTFHGQLGKATTRPKRRVSRGVKNPYKVLNAFPTRNPEISNLKINVDY